MNMQFQYSLPALSEKCVHGFSEKMTVGARKDLRKYITEEGPCGYAPKSLWEHGGHRVGEGSRSV